MIVGVGVLCEGDRITEGDIVWHGFKRHFVPISTELYHMPWVPEYGVVLRRNSQNNIERNDSGKERQPCGENNTPKATIALCDVQRILNEYAGKINVMYRKEIMEKIAQQ